MSELTIVSIVGTGSIDKEIDLNALSDDIQVYSHEYNPEKSPGILMKFYEEAPSVTIFRTGSILIRGAETKQEVYKNVNLLQETFSSLGIDISSPNIKITNIVFTGEISSSINLNELSLQLGLESIEYEPEQFPGLVYRINDGVILVFSSGKLVLTGYTDLEVAKQAYITLRDIIIND